MDGEAAAAGPSDPPEASSPSNKITLLLKATGDAPILKKRKWVVEPQENILYVINFLRRAFKLNSSDSLFVYVNQTFAPSPDQNLRNLYDCFGADGKLVLHYAKSQAWG